MKKIIPFILLWVIACSEEETTSRDYPRVYTKDVSNISGDGTTFHAEITYSSVEILDHGFVWSGSDYDPSIESGDRISLGSLNGAGLFDAIADRCMEDGKNYVVRAYAISSDFTVYGDAIEYKSLGSKNKVQINSFQPTSGITGQDIIIQGNFFSGVKTQNKVSFGSYKAEVIAASQNQLTVRIPQFEPTNNLVNIIVAVEGSSAVSQEKFKFSLPEIESIIPSTAIIAKTLVEINGSGFGSSAAFLNIKFADKTCLVTGFSSTKITIQLPADAPVGSYPITIEGLGVVEQSSSNLTSVSPWTFQSELLDVYADASVAPMVIGDKVYIKCLLNEFWEYDINDQSWLRKTDAPFDGGGISFALNGQVYVVNEDTHVYDPTMNSWSMLTAPDIDYSQKPSISVANRGYAFLSTSPGGVQRYDAFLDEWYSLSQPPSYDFFFSYSGGFLIGNTMYVGLGNYMTDQKKFWKYDIAADTWTQLKTFPGNAFTLPVAFEIYGKGYMGSGYRYGYPQRDFWEYNQATDGWSRRADLPAEIRGVGSFSFLGRGYVVSHTDVGVKIWSYEP